MNSSSSSSSTSSSALNLAMAALVGASLMAVSAFYIHKRSVDQVIDRLIEIRRKPPHTSSRVSTDDDDDEEEDRIEDDDHLPSGETFIDRKTTPSDSYRIISSSLPNADMRTGCLIEDDGVKFDPLANYRAPRSSSSADRPNFIPSGLPPLRTDKSNDSQSRMATSMSRLTSSRSHAGIIDDSDDEGTGYANEDDSPYGDANDNSVFQNEVLRTSNNFIQEVEGGSAQMGRMDPSFARSLLPLTAPLN